MSEIELIERTEEIIREIIISMYELVNQQKLMLNNLEILCGLILT